LLGKVRDAERRCPTSGRAWSTFGPHAIGAERFATVSSGLQREIIRAGCRRDPGETGSRAEPDKDEVAPAPLLLLAKVQRPQQAEPA